MELNSILLIIAVALLLGCLGLLIVLLRRSAAKNGQDEAYARLGELLQRELRESRTESNTIISNSFQALSSGLGQSLLGVDKRLADFSLQNEQKLDQMRGTIQERLAGIQEDNNKKLEQMRVTVDEKLQRTLNERLGQSFKMVSDQLEQVQKGLGEMQTLATGVGELKNVLSNVKTRGTLGEIQLGAILEEILSPGQYDSQVRIKADSQEKVDYAVKMPTDDGGNILLPIDSKFPLDSYAALIDAYDTSDTIKVDAAAKNLTTQIKAFAKSISQKYVDPPNTTDFAVMFLPVEGLYAEAVRRGMVEVLQRDYKITMAGPTTMAALLNSLQMGFRSLAIQKRTSEVWKVLGEVKTEFGKFGTILSSAQKRLVLANNELDQLVGTRTRAIERKLRDVTALPGEDEPIGLEDGESSSAADEDEVESLI